MSNEHQKKLKELNRINRRIKIPSVSNDGFLAFIYQSLEDKSAEAHVPNDYLLIFNGWKQRAERSADATLSSPPGLTSETNLSQAVNTNIAQNPPFVKGKNEKNEE